jgi:anaerobic magnesium-protoporphyrin IX monomethyl ester cyclase
MSSLLFKNPLSPHHSKLPPIVLIEPPQILLAGNEQNVAIPPLGLAYIAATLQKANYPVLVIDGLGLALHQTYKLGKQQLRGLYLEEIVERLPAQTDIVGIRNLFTFAFPVIIRLCILLKKRFPTLKIILGGEHPTALPQFTLECTQADLIVLGEGEATLLEVIPALRNATNLSDLKTIQGIAFKDPSGNFIQTPPRPPLNPVDQIPWPAYHLFPIEDYIASKSPCGPALGRWLPLLATRGCPYKCNFCTAPSMWDSWRPRSIEALVEEMSYWNQTFGIKDFQFNDLTIGTDRRWIEKFSQALLDSPLTPEISWQAVSGTRVDQFKKETLQLMYDSGCKMICLAPETGSQRLSKAIGKSMNLEKILQVSQWCHEIGIKTSAFIVYGFPQENRRDYLQTFKWLVSLAQTGCDATGVGLYHLLPGTADFKALSLREKRILNNQWVKEIAKIGQPLQEPSYSQVFQTPLQLQSIRWITIFWYFLNLWRLHPKKLWILGRNLLQGKQETKLDRVLQVLCSSFLHKVKYALARISFSARPPKNFPSQHP